MSVLARLRSWLQGATRRSRFERDMDEELRFHIESFAEDLVRAGVSPADARRRAAAEFGGVEARKEDCRQAIGLRWLDEIAGDLRYGIRQLKRSPAFTAVAIASLALGIGANSAIFSLMETALWKPAPVHEPQRLRLLSWVSGPRAIMNSSWGNWSRTVAGGRASTSFSYVAYDIFTQADGPFEAVFAFKPIGRVTAIVDGHADMVSAQLVSGNFYGGVGVMPGAGRLITADDDTEAPGETVAVISDGFWARRFGRERSAIGRQITVNQVPVTIVGVNPAGFSGMDPAERPDLYLPLKKQPLVSPNRHARGGSLLDDPDYWWVLVMGRLKPGASDAQAQVAAETTFQRIVRTTLPSRPDRDQPQLRLLPGARGQDNLREQFATPLVILITLVGLVLSIACANVATLLLARAAGRRRELSLRLALGAGRWRVARQLLTEGLTLGIGGGVVGLFLGYWVRDAIPGLLVPSWVSELRFDAEFDSRVLLLSIAVTIATSVLFSVAPIWQAVRGGDVNSALKDGGRSASGAAHLRHGRSLIVFQVCLSVVLLVGAGLFVRTLWNLRSVDVGFKPERIVLFTIDPPRAKYGGSARKALFVRLQEQMAAIPGVEAASLSESPLLAGGSSRTRVGPDGRRPGPKDEAWVSDVGTQFFETMGIPIVAGRALDARDGETSAPAAVVSEQFVRDFFPRQNPLGRTLRNGDKLFQIVGVCGDIRFGSARAPAPPLFYRHFTQAGEPGARTFEVRTSIATASLMNSVRQAVGRIDADLPVSDVRTQEQQIDATFARERLFVTLTLAFGALALLLASIGIYGTVAHSVARRTSEIGIRLALGANRRQVRLMILREASSPAALGAVIGLAVAALLTRSVQTMLFGVQPLDPVTLALAVALVLAVAVLAGWLPARRASRLDPMVALRHE